LGLISLPYNPQPSDPEDITEIMANFGAVLAQVNGNLESSSNVKVGVAALPLAGSASAEGSSASLARADHMHLVQGVEVRSSQPSSGHFAGRVYYDTTDARLKVCYNAGSGLYASFMHFDGADGTGRMLYGSAAGTNDWLLTAAPTDGQILRAVGTAPTWGDAPMRVLNQTGTILDIVSTAAETTLYTFDVPANTIGANGSLVLELAGDWQVNSGTPDLTLRIKYGGTTFHSAARTSIPTTAARGVWHLRCILQNLNSTGAQHLHGDFAMSDRSGAATGIGQHDTNDLFTSEIGSAATDPTVDSTILQTLLVTAQWSASAADRSIRRKSGTLTLVKA
jgi:hypothetical protein